MFLQIACLVIMAKRLYSEVLSGSDSDFSIGDYEFRPDRSSPKPPSLLEYQDVDESVALDRALQMSLRVSVQFRFCTDLSI